MVARLVAKIHIQCCFLFVGGLATGVINEAVCGHIPHGFKIGVGEWLTGYIELNAAHTTDLT